MPESIFTVRKYVGRDTAACARCFYEGFFDCPLTDGDVEFLQDYAQVLIEKCGFAYVAEAGGEVVGFICGSYQKLFDRSLAKRHDTKQHYGAWIKCFAKFYFGGYKCSSAFKEQFGNFFRQVRERGKDTPMKCDCELVALSSRKDFRKGVGTALWRAFSERCKTDGAKVVRLFTNSDASYAFYERRGFARIWEKEYSFGGGSSYVYEYIL